MLALLVRVCWKMHTESVLRNDIFSQKTKTNKIIN